MPGGPTYESELRQQSERERNAALVQAGVPQEEAKSRGSLAELNRAAELANTTEKSVTAKGVLDKVEGGANKAAVPGRAKPKKDPNEIDMSEEALQQEQQRRLEEDRKRNAAKYERWYGKRNSALF